MWQSGFSRVYSNCYCSCWFEPEIIKIGQSSYKMYSNKILNFQESTSILNARTKNSGNLSYAPRFFRWEFNLYGRRINHFVHGSPNNWTRQIRRFSVIPSSSRSPFLTPFSLPSHINHYYYYYYYYYYKKATTLRVILKKFY